ncbi:MAG: nitrogenase molybdenum-iron protein alpha chain [Deltaproteobacteria bacterium]|nr:nitrogenase molybdenum-iron protein alpha chain [Deltaproteobacteria bacterium]
MTTKATESQEDIRDDLLRAYPAKVARKRAQQMQFHEPSEDLPAKPIKANTRTVPGIISQRGCTYAGCKGVVLGPTRDIVNITHGPIGCGFYSWLTRRNQTRPPTAEDANFMNYCFSTDMQEENIIFGGEKKLKEAIQEAHDLFKPKAIGVFSTCPVGLIGDDVHAVSREMEAKLGITIFGFSCEGYRGVSQSAGHHIANNQLFKHVVGLDDTPQTHPFSINLLGEYNIGGDAFVIEDLLQRCGIHLVATFSGNSSFDFFANSHTADLNAVMCHRSINYMADMMEKKFGIPWIKINFIGAEATAKSLRKIAQFFDSDILEQQVEKVIAEEMPAVLEAQKRARSRLENKTAMLFVGGSRAHHYQTLFKEMGMKVVAAGYEFAHRDDYEGRRVLDTIQVDADSRNIEELEVHPDPQRFKPRMTDETKARLEREGLKFSDYEGMMPEMDPGALVIDDISHHEMERLIARFRPDIFCAGIKEKYGIQKMGIPCKQLHSYDYGGPYAGFTGAIEFYEEIDRLVNSRFLQKIRAPWHAEGGEVAVASVEATDDPTGTASSDVDYAA